MKTKVREPVSGKGVLLDLGKHSLGRIVRSPGTWPEECEALGIRGMTRRLDKNVWVTGWQHHGWTSRVGPYVALNLRRQCFWISKAFCLFFVFFFFLKGIEKTFPNPQLWGYSWVVSGREIRETVYSVQLGTISRLANLCQKKSRDLGNKTTNLKAAQIQSPTGPEVNSFGPRASILQSPLSFPEVP